MVTKAYVHKLHRAMLDLDHQYANNPTYTTHRALLRAQRLYYRALHLYHLHHTATYTRVQRSHQIMQRARYNLARERANPHWHLIATHAYQRATQVRMLLLAYQELDHDTTPPQPTTPPPPKPKPRPRRIVHPITGRYVYQ